MLHVLCRAARPCTSLWPIEQGVPPASGHRSGRGPEPITSNARQSTHLQEFASISYRGLLLRLHAHLDCAVTPRG